MALPLTLPLRGSQLIEASAGTGKTFTIALLYVRLVLGHGAPDDDNQPGDNGYHRPLLPPEILVVTFTDAATQELRMRIRERLVQAADAFREPPEQADLGSDDPLLSLRNTYATGQWPSCARRLQVAADWMDESAVSTIHGWAYRMLREHAFDSGNLFRQELVKDQTELERDAVNDYWRQRFYPLDALAAAHVHDCFTSPDVLHKALKQPLMREDAELMYEGLPLQAGDLEAHLRTLVGARAACEQAEAAARTHYRDEAHTVRGLLAKLRPGVNKATYARFKDEADFEACLQELDAWANDASEAPYFIDKLLEKGLKLNKGYTVPDHAFFHQIDTWRDALNKQAADEKQLRALILADARHWVRRRLDEQLTERSELGFNELLKRLDAALHGPKGDTLAARIRQQFPVAMIDEFQDTDPVQYRLFDRVYRVADNDESCCLVLIGDPKQAIYGFRGADIHTYLKARRATTGRHHTLGRNFRSTAAMVEAVNHVFQRAETFPRAAFRFRDSNDNPLPFNPVDTKGRDEALVLHGEPPAAFTAWLDRSEDSLGTTRFRLRLAEQAAEQITQWLNAGQQGLAGFDDGNRIRPLRPGDIAVLVRNRTEAVEIRAAMERRGLASVYLSDRDSVFETPEAQDVLAWLRACARPEDDGLLRAALASRSLDLPLAELDRLHEDELFWESRQERFYEYHNRWNKQGVLPMLRRLLHDFQVAERLLQRPDGERRMTNLLHLAEWAQQASDTLDGPHTLVRVLAERVLDPPREEQVLRLESDAELIQVVTIHKSKGLEYPLVVLPFACSWREVSSKDKQALYHRNGMRLEVSGSREAAEEADDERLSEDLRLLYVALTRARHATFIGLAALEPNKRKNQKSAKAKLHRSAMGYLLAGGAEISDTAQLAAQLDALRQGCAQIRVQAIPDLVRTNHYQPAPATAWAFQPARKTAHQPFERWWVASYSSLGTQADTGTEEPETAEEATRHEESEPAGLTGAVDQQRAGPQPADGGIHAFPRGPGPGTFLHGLLEWAGERGFDQALESPDWEHHLRQRCSDRQWSEHVAALDTWMRALLRCPLIETKPGAQLRLSDLDHYKVEQEFWFAVRRGSTAELDALIRRHILPDQPRPSLKPTMLNGLLKGFIDLVAEHDGRYYVIDWKSNHLGPDDGHYTQVAMEQALLEKRYDVQLSLYLLALHRHLRHRLGAGYDYDMQMGGALYVFLRGVGAPGHGVLRQCPPRSFIEALDAMLDEHADREAG